MGTSTGLLVDSHCYTLNFRDSRSGGRLVVCGSSGAGRRAKGCRQVLPDALAVPEQSAPQPAEEAMAAKARPPFLENF